MSFVPRSRGKRGASGIALGGCKRKRSNIQILRSKKFPIEHIQTRMKIWMDGFKSSSDEYDLLPAVYSTDKEVQHEAHFHGYFTLREPKHVSFCWAFWNGKNDAVKREIQLLTQKGYRVLIFPEENRG
jgi:hypothetical protein